MQGSPPAPPFQGSARRRVSIAVIPKQLLVRTGAGGTGRSCAPLSDVGPRARCDPGSGSPLMLPPLVPSQVPARTAEQPRPASWRGRGPSAGPAPRGNRAGWRGGHGTGCELAWGGMAQHPVFPLPRSELEPQGQSGAVTGEPAAKADGRGSSGGDEEPEQLGLM